jgi:hypothetical protein
MQNSEWQAGWRLYADGYSVEWCRTETEKRGWWAANKAQGWAEVNA